MISALIDMQRHSGQDTVPMSDLAQLGQNIQALGIIHDILTKEAKSERETEFISASEVLEKGLPPILRTTLGENVNCSRLSNRSPYSASTSPPWRSS